MVFIICKYCNEEYLQTVFDKTGRCSECGKIINPKFEENKPVKKSKYTKSTSIATETVNHAEKAKKNVPEQEVEAEEIKDVPNIKEKDFSAKIDSIVETKEIQAEPEQEEEIDELAALGLFSLDDGLPEEGLAQEETQSKSTEIQTAPEISQVRETKIETTLEDKQSMQEVETIQARKEMPKGVSDKKQTSYEEEKTDNDDKEKKKSLFDLTKNKENTKKEIFETEHRFDFNKDGFYDDVEPVEPAKPDAISKTVFVKAVGVVVALFLIITFLIYYA